MATADSTITYRDIPGFPGYRAGDDGSIWSCWKKTHTKGVSGSKHIIDPTSWMRLKPYACKSGHLRVHIKGAVHLVHRLVLLAFVGPAPNGLLCCHGDDDPANNALTNLRWDTPKSNGQDQVKNGRSNQGVRHGISKCTDESVRQMRDEYAAGNTSYKELAKKHGVHASTVSDIIHRVTWPHVL
jgi:hypothetical protein